MQKPKPHKQEKSYSCAVACLRMVLEYYGIRESEQTLRLKSKCKFYGTHPIHVVECAKSYGLKAYVASLTMSKLELINQNIPVIANIVKNADDGFYVHSVVVYRMETGIVYLLDPEDGDIKLEADLFERLWQSDDYTAVIIEKP